MKPFENRSLFSDHYLDERLPDHREWSEEVEGAWSELRALFARQRPLLEGMNEAQTEEEWVKPILGRVLGWSYSVQTDATLFGRRNRPDYALFPSEEAKRAAQAAGADGRLDYSRAAAVGDAKFWGRPLDRELRDPRDRLTNTNPSFQIVNYLVATGVDWGILTNGREWRLYSMRARSRVDTYYAVDLQRILEAESLESFRYFYHFFRADAFRPDPRGGRGFLDAVLSAPSPMAPSWRSGSSGSSSTRSSSTWPPASSPGGASAGGSRRRRRCARSTRARCGCSTGCSSCSTPSRATCSRCAVVMPATA